MEIIILNDENEVAEQTAKIFLKQVENNKKSILGLATGASPILTYQKLVKAYNEGIISYKDVITFNLDEYVGLETTNPQSYRYFMNKELFNKIDIDLKNTFIPDSNNITNPEVYDLLIEKYGGIDLQLLGLGTNGHVGFNEPGANFKSKTSLVDLAEETIKVNAEKFFKGNTNEVPKQAISMGLSSIMQAKMIVLIATGKTKQEAVYHLVKGEISEQWPCTILRSHQNFTLILDSESSRLIK